VRPGVDIDLGVEIAAEGVERFAIDAKTHKVV